MKDIFHIDNPKPIYLKSISEFNAVIDQYATLQNVGRIQLTAHKCVAQNTKWHVPASLLYKKDNHFEFVYVGAEGPRLVIKKFAYSPAYDEGASSARSRAEVTNALNEFRGFIDLIPSDEEFEDPGVFTCPENPEAIYYGYCNPMFRDIMLSGCSSLDCNGSFMASAAELFPATRPYVDAFQEKKLRIKAIPKEERTAEEQAYLQYDKIVIGWLKNRNFKKYHAWDAIIDASNRRVHALRKEIEAAGCQVLLVNTDAVKFKGNFDYQPSMDMGGFKYEFKDAQMFIKGIKSYAYNEDGTWHFKQAGKCKLDNIKPREEWTIEDFTTRDIDDTAKVAHIMISNEAIPHLEVRYEYEG